MSAPGPVGSASPPALRVRGLRRAYGGVEALGGVDLDVASGERFCLLGPSGSGKTTLLRLVAGFEDADDGAVEIAGARMDGVPPERRGVGVVFQDYALFGHRSVEDNVGFGLRMQRVPRARREARVAELLELVGLRAEARRRPAQLSGGQRQRVALARALAPEPALLLLDEPLANLDRRLRESLRAELMELPGRVGVTTVLVTHDQEEALSLADRVGVLREGRLEQLGTPAQVWQEPATRFVAGFLGEMNLLPATPDGHGRALVGVLDALLDVRGETPSGPAVACLRPEALALRAPGEGGASGTVAATAYAGGSITYRVDLPGHPGVLVREPLPDGRAAWSGGAPVGVHAHPVPCRLLPA